MKTGLILGLLALLLLVAAVPFSASYSLSGTTTAGGGERPWKEGYLTDSLGQPWAGTASSDLYRLDAGLLAWADAGKQGRPPVTPLPSGEQGEKREREPGKKE